MKSLRHRLPSLAPVGAAVPNTCSFYVLDRTYARVWLIEDRQLYAAVKKHNENENEKPTFRVI